MPIQASQLPLQAGHPIADPRTGLLTPPWVIFFQHLIRGLRDAMGVLIDLGNLAPVSAGSRLLGRGNTGPGPIQEILLGPGLAMADTTLTLTSGMATVGYWTPISNGSSDSPEILFDANGDVVVGFVPTG